jgi:flagella basal body P-ring formation protein FlgA
VGSRKHESTKGRSGCDFRRAVAFLPVRDSASCFGGSGRFAPRTAAATCALFWAALLGVWMLGECGPARATEVRLRAQSTAAGPLVTLGDVAEILAADPAEAAALAAVELFAAPAGSHQRFVRVREIQDLLILRGVDLRAHRFSGSAVVAVAGPGTSRPAAPEAVAPQTVRRAERRLAEQVAVYLEGRADDAKNLMIECSVSGEQARLAAEPAMPITLGGGAPPWTGPQRFDAVVATPQGPVQFSFDATVRVPPAMVVAVRAMGRGHVIRPTDVAIEPGATPGNGREGFHALEDVVGKETTQAVAAGRALDRESVRAPLWVRRGEVVTVQARTGAVRVRTTARARDDGSHGDLVAVESLADRTSYHARVVGIREVEVYARGVQAAGD